MSRRRGGRVKRTRSHLGDEDGSDGDDFAGTVNDSTDPGLRHQLSKLKLSAFVRKLALMVGSSEYAEYLSWGQNGTSIVVNKVAEFSDIVLPKFFKHGNFSSFVRQLNMYGFGKVSLDPSCREFHHPNFRKGRYDLLPFVKRKVSQQDSIAMALKAGVPVASPLPDARSRRSTRSRAGALSEPVRGMVGASHPTRVQAAGAAAPSAAGAPPPLLDARLHGTRPAVSPTAEFGHAEHHAFHHPAMHNAQALHRSGEDLSASLASGRALSERTRQLERLVEQVRREQAESQASAAEKEREMAALQERLAQSRGRQAELEGHFKRLVYVMYALYRGTHHDLRAISDTPSQAGAIMDQAAAATAAVATSAAAGGHPNQGYEFFRRAGLMRAEPASMEEFVATLIAPKGAVDLRPASQSARPALEDRSVRPALEDRSALPALAETDSPALVQAALAAPPARDHLEEHSPLLAGSTGLMSPSGGGGAAASAAAGLAGAPTAKRARPDLAVAAPAAVGREDDAFLSPGPSPELAMLRPGGGRMPRIDSRDVAHSHAAELADHQHLLLAHLHTAQDSVAARLPRGVVETRSYFAAPRGARSAPSEPDRDGAEDLLQSVPGRTADLEPTSASDSSALSTGVGGSEPMLAASASAPESEVQSSCDGGRDEGAAAAAAAAAGSDNDEPGDWADDDDGSDGIPGLADIPDEELAQVPNLLRTQSHEDGSDSPLARLTGHRRMPHIDSGL